MLAFKVDENLPAEATTLLQKAGFDAMAHVDQLTGLIPRYRAGGAAS